jgi:Zn-dependent protease/Flp pilus assembly protein TadD
MSVQRTPDRNSHTETDPKSFRATDAVAPRRCGRCGAESTLAGSFRLGGWRRGRLLCAGCQSRRRWWPLVALFGFIVVLANVERLKAPSFVIATGLPLLALAVVVHEAGHAIAAMLLDLRVLMVLIGRSSEPLFAFSIGRTRVWLCGVPFNGLVSVLPNGPDWIPWRVALFYAAGPIANLAAAFAASRLGAVDSPGGYLLSAFGVVNALVGFANLVPRRVRRAALGPPSDGSCLIEAIRSKRRPVGAHMRNVAVGNLALTSLRFEEAAELLSRATQEKSDLGLSVNLAYALMRLKRYQDARDVLYPKLREQEPIDETWALACNNAAWADVMLGDKRSLDEADALSRQAYELAPWRPPIKGTRGAVLVLRGDVAAGEDLLHAAFRGNRDRQARATNLCWLAVAAAARGDASKVEDYLRRARNLHAECELPQCASSLVERCRAGASPSSPRPDAIA